eukprot:INCI5067.4.p1 GENE.INCI5067.4~~INCI5067.4.p1  ORF type:complete len:2987 (-),score=541.17 INCI5067.4:2687-10468(-)
MGTDIPPHMSTKRHSFLITNEAAQKTYVSCLVWRERFEPTLEFILNDDEVCTMFEAHLDTEGANDDQLRHDFEVVKLIHRLVCSTGMHDSCSSVSRTSAAAGEDSGDELPHLESALLLQVEQYAKQHELKFSKEHPENLLQQVVQKSRLRAYIASFHMFAPRAIAVTSDFPYFETFGQFLQQVHRLVFTGSSIGLPIERIIQFFMTDIPRPPRGYVTVQFRLTEAQDSEAPLMSISGAPRNAMPKIHFDMRPTFAALRPASIVRIFGCLLLEMRVVICGSDLDLVFSSCETFRHLLFPFNWQHPYIPVFAYPWMPLLRAPVPFFVGMPASLLTDDLRNALCSSGVVIVDLDKHAVTGVRTAHRQVSEMYGLADRNNPFSVQTSNTVLPVFYYNQLHSQLEKLCNSLSVAEALTAEVSQDRGYSTSAVNANAEAAAGAAAAFEKGVRQAFVDVLAQYMHGYDTFVNWEWATMLPDAGSGNQSLAGDEETGESHGTAEMRTERSSIFDTEGFIRTREHKYGASEEFFRGFPETSLFTEFLHKRIWSYEPSAEQMFFDYSINRNTEESRAFFDDDVAGAKTEGSISTGFGTVGANLVGVDAGSRQRSLLRASSERKLASSARPIYIAPPDQIHGSETVLIVGTRYLISAPFHGKPVERFPRLRMECFSGVSDSDQEAVARAAAKVARAHDADSDDSFSSSDEEHDTNTRTATDAGCDGSLKHTKSFTEAIDEHSKAEREAAEAQTEIREPLARFKYFSILGTGSKRDKAIVLDLEKRALRSSADLGASAGDPSTSEGGDVRGFTVFDTTRLGSLDSFHRGTKARFAMEDEDLNIIVHFSTRILNERFNCRMLNTRPIRKQVERAITVAREFCSMLEALSRLVERRGNVFAKTVGSFQTSRAAQDQPGFLTCTEAQTNQSRQHKKNFAASPPHNDCNAKDAESQGANSQQINSAQASSVDSNVSSSRIRGNFASISLTPPKMKNPFGSMRGLSTSTAASNAHDGMLDPDEALAQVVWPNLCAVLPSLLGHIRGLADKVKSMVLTPLTNLLRRFENTRRTLSDYKDKLIEDLLTRRKATERAQKVYFDAYYRAQEAHHELEAASLVHQHGLDADAGVRKRRAERLTKAELQNAACQAKAFSAELAFTAAVVALQNSLRAFMTSGDTLIASISEDDSDSVHTLVTLLGALADLVHTTVGKSPNAGFRGDIRGRRRMLRQNLVPHQQEIAFAVPQSAEETLSRNSAGEGRLISLQFVSGLVVEQELPSNAKPGDRFSATIPITPLATIPFESEDERHRKYLSHTDKASKATSAVAQSLKAMVLAIDAVVKGSPELSAALQIHKTFLTSDIDSRTRHGDGWTGQEFDDCDKSVELKDTDSDLLEAGRDHAHGGALLGWHEHEQPKNVRKAPGLSSVLSQRSMASALQAMKSHFTMPFASPFLNSPAGKYDSWHSEMMASPNSFGQFNWKRRLSCDAEDLSGATITNNSEHGPPRSPGGLGHVRRLQLDPGEEDSSDSDVEPDDGEADLGAGSPVLEIVPVDLPKSPSHVRLDRRNLRSASDVSAEHRALADSPDHFQDASGPLTREAGHLDGNCGEHAGSDMHEPDRDFTGIGNRGIGLHVNLEHSTFPSDTKSENSSSGPTAGFSPGNLAATTETVSLVEWTVHSFFNMLRCHFQEVARCYVMLDDMAGVSKCMGDEAREKLAEARRSIDRSVRAKAESEKTLRLLQANVDKTFREFESQALKLANHKFKMPDVRYEWPNSAALARDIKWKTKTDLSNLFKKKADCVNAHIGALLQPNRDALAIGGLKKDYMLRMVNNESVVGKSFDRIMHILGLAGDQRGTAAASEPLILDFGCEFYAQEKEATAKHAHALDALEEGRIQDARRGIELEQLQSSLETLRTDAMIQLEKHAIVRLNGVIEHIPEMDAVLAESVARTLGAVSQAKKWLHRVDVDKDLKLPPHLKRLTEPFNVAPLHLMTSPSQRMGSSPISSKAAHLESVNGKEGTIGGVFSGTPGSPPRPLQGAIDRQSSDLSAGSQEELQAQAYADVVEAFSRAGKAAKAVGSLRRFFELLELKETNAGRQLRGALDAFANSEALRDRKVNIDHGRTPSSDDTEAEQEGTSDAMPRLSRFLMHLCDEEIRAGFASAAMASGSAANRLQCVEACLRGAVSALRRSFLPKDQEAAHTFLFGGRTPVHGAGAAVHSYEDNGEKSSENVQQPLHPNTPSTQNGDSSSGALSGEVVSLFDVFLQKPMQRSAAARAALVVANQELIAAKRDFNESALFAASSRRKLVSAQNVFERAQLLSQAHEIMQLHSQDIWANAIQTLRIQLNELAAKAVDAMGDIVTEFLAREEDNFSCAAAPPPPSATSASSGNGGWNMLPLGKSSAADTLAASDLTETRAVVAGDEVSSDCTLRLVMRVSNLLHHFAMAQAARFITPIGGQSGPASLRDALAACLRNLPAFASTDTLHHKIHEAAAVLPRSQGSTLVQAPHPTELSSVEVASADNSFRRERARTHSAGAEMVGRSRRRSSKRRSSRASNVSGSSRCRATGRRGHGDRARTVRCIRAVWTFLTARRDLAALMYVVSAFFNSPDAQLLCTG